MELISTQRMSYESWLHTWNLEDDDDFSSGDDDDGESRDTNTKERSATLKDFFSKARPIENAKGIVVPRRITRG